MTDPTKIELDLQVLSVEVAADTDTVVHTGTTREYVEVEGDPGELLVLEGGEQDLLEVVTDGEAVVATVPTREILEVAAGPPGPQGPPGADGADGTIAYYAFEQLAPSATWTVNHNLDGFFSVTVVDSGGTTVEGSIAYQDANTIVITFSVPFSGTVYLS